MVDSSKKEMRICLVQLNPVVGDIEGNLHKVSQARAEARGSDLLVLSELFVCGYPPEDLVLRPSFIAEVRRGVEFLAQDTQDGGPGVLLGAPWEDDGQLYNAALLLQDGHVAAVRHKRFLPNYDVFDEKRLFTPGCQNTPIAFGGAKLGVLVCEDMWSEEGVGSVRDADILVVLNASPFHEGKSTERLARAAVWGLPLIYVNQVGGQDDLTFDGASFVLSGSGEVCVQAAAWEEAVVMTQWRCGVGGWTCQTEASVPAAHVPPPTGEAAIYKALTTGLRDYVEKNGFTGVLLGLSGGIDSAFTATLAVDALGAERVRCVLLPSQWTSRESVEDARACAEALGVRLEEMSIEATVSALEAALKPVTGGGAAGVMEENLQSRARGVLLMALSNKTGALLLSTGNKSEMSVGYATLYGDMNGGFNPLKDLYKTQVYALSRWRNEAGVVIPERILRKAPSAELRPNQKDEDSLPPYPQLDAILTALIDEERSVKDIEVGPPEVVREVAALVRRAEYKRRQAPPGVKVTRRHFGRGRRYPITNRYVEER